MHNLVQNSQSESNIKWRKKSPNPPLCSSYTKKYWIAPSRRVCIFFLVASTFELFSSVIITSCTFLLCLKHIEAIFLWSHNIYSGKFREILGNLGKSWEILDTIFRRHYHLLLVSALLRTHWGHFFMKSQFLSWKILGSPGKSCEILGNPVKFWEIPGNPGKSWEILGNSGKSQ